MTQGRVQTS